MAQTDRFYNAPEGPAVQPDIELPRRAHYDIQSSPNMFGGLIAQGLQEAGKSISDATNTFSQVAADQATNNFMGDLSTQRAAFEATRGQDTMQAHDDYVTGLDKTFQANRATVPPQALKDYDNFSRRYLFNAKEAAASHLAQQSNSWAQGVAVSKDQAATAAISQNPNDEANFQLNSEQMAKAAVNQVQLKEGIHDYATATPEAQGIIRNAYDQARAKAAYARIEAIRPTDPAQALQWQKDYAPILGKLGPEVQQQLKGYEQQQKIQQGVQDANAHVTGGGTQVGGAPAGKTSPPDVYANIPDVDKQGQAGQKAKFQQWNPDPIGNSDKILATVHPDLQAIVKKAQADNPSLPFVVALGKTTPEQGVQAHKWGWATSDSNAGTQAHDRGEVVDLWPLNGKNQVDFDPAKQRQISDAMHKAAGELGQTLRWGGLASEGGQNHTFRDAPNFQLQNPKPWDQSSSAPAPTVPAAFTRQSPTVQTATLSAGVAGVRVPPQYAPMVQSAGAKYGVDPTLLARQLQAESSFNPNARSPAGAEGIAQFIPGTAARYGVNVHDPASSIEGQAHYMGDLQKMFGGNQGLALAGYNWGEGNVQRWLRAGADPAHLPAETAKYVRSITGHDLAEWVQNPGVAIHTTPLGPGQQNEGVQVYHAGGSPSGETFYRPTAPGPGGAPSGGSAPIFPGPSGSPDQGGSGQSASLAPAIQPASFGGPGGGGAPQQGQAPATEGPQSGYEAVRDHVSQAMLYTMGRTDIDEHLKDQILGEQEKQLRQATFAAEQDSATRSKLSNAAVDRSLMLAMGQNGQPGDAQAGFHALTDAFQRGVIDEPAYERGTAALTKFSGQEDLRAYGPGYADIMTGKTKIQSLSDIQALAAHGDLTKKGYDAAKADLTYAEKGESGDYLTRKKYAYDAAAAHIDWQTPTAPGMPETRADRQKAADKMSDFANIFEDSAKKYRQDHNNDMSGFELFDAKKRQAVLDQIYPPRERAKDMGQGGLTQPQATAADQQWAAAAHPPAPAGFDQRAWQDVVAQPPATPDGFPLPHAEWDLRLRTLAQNPSPEVRQFWDSRYGPKGTIATGPTADVVLRDLRGNIGHPETPTPGRAAAPSAPAPVGTPLAGGAEAIRRGVANAPHSVAPLPGVMHDLGNLLGVGQGNEKSPFPPGADFGPSVESRE